MPILKCKQPPAQRILTQLALVHNTFPEAWKSEKVKEAHSTGTLEQ